MKLLWRLVKPHLHLIALSFLGSLVYSAGNAGLALTVKKVVDEVFVERNADELYITALALLGYGLTAQTGQFISSYLIGYASERLVKELRKELFHKLLKSPLNVFLATSSGDAVSRALNDVELLRQLVAEHVPKLLREPFLVAALAGVLIYRDAYLTLYLTLLAPPFYFITRYFSDKKKKHLKRQREQVSRLASLINESFRGIESIKLFMAESFFLKRFEQASELLFRASVKLHAYALSNSFTNYLFGYAVVAVFLLLGGRRVAEGVITAGDFVSYLTALFMLQKPLMDLQKAVMHVKGAEPLFERLEGFLKLPAEKDGTEPFRGLKKELRLERVSVKADGKEILKEVSLTVKKGEKVGIKGPTGSGKSTLLRVLPRLVEYEGSVLVDGVELRRFRLSSLRARVSMATQEPFLFKGTVRENLLIAKPGATEEELIKSLELAACEFVLSSPYGLDYPVEEGGRNLSGGERQRLGLARVFLRGGELILLDEPTSALDAETERRVLNNLFTVFKEKTVFIVAHRESNFAYCSLLLELEEGKVKKVRRL
ncbi:MAG: ABC transporter ATP-binding protein [Aquificae bacterium]|nr:ABC transporter ATP-binding protein [Aquificota bacterium]